MTQHSQFALLGKRRFLPFFITQLLGAFNDNIFKQSLILAILYHLSVSGDRSLLVNLCALLFILPFFLFSALGGQFGEKYNKDALMRALKLAEVGIMLVGAAGFVFGSLPLMFVALSSPSPGASSAWGSASARRSRARWWATPGSGSSARST